ncbi:MAG: glycerol-3-phosphate dehydrogenase [Janthinobacterium lividum]
MERDLDLLVIGGGINGAGIARDAAGRGLAVALVEAGDFGGGIPGASSKLIDCSLRHLGLRRLGRVRKALAEREILLDIAPHISRPQAFVFPHVPGRRPDWLLRAGLILYDHLARRDAIPGSTRVDLRQDRAGRALQPRYGTAVRYWDSWVDDDRLVVANVRDAADRGASIHPRSRAVAADWDGTRWRVMLDHGRALVARQIVNATGPWVQTVARTVLKLGDAPALRLVQSSHIVTRRINLGNDAFVLQQPDGRIVFVIPYEQDFTLIGTTEHGVDDAVATPITAPITADERRYLLDAANRYLVRALTERDIVHSHAAVHSLLLESGKGGRETSRNDRIMEHDGVPALSVVGGRIATYRVLAEAVMAKVAPKSKRWTATAPLPGGGVERLAGENGQAAFARWLKHLTEVHENYDPKLINRLARSIGIATESLLARGLGRNLGGVFEAELAYYAADEWATTADDVLWRRTKLGLHLDAAAKARVAAWFGDNVPAGTPASRFVEPA